MGLIEIVLIISVLLNIALVYAAWNSVKKIETFESERERVFLLLNNLLQDLREIDERQMFEKDDEVGTIFEQLKEIIEFYYKLIKENN